ncbi:MAG: 4-alpha-glucanotransferase [Oscillospiraceae bacterium]|nr:4-alpha-glucanotransferase [Oscillospiraceae bacterium]
MDKSRASGILMAVSSLPGPYGIGSLGSSARQFVDFLAQSGQTYWQILPLVPSGDGASPYMSPSSYAGSPYYIDLDLLVAEGLLTPDEVAPARYYDPDRVDYDWLARTRMPLLKLAFSRSEGMDFADYDWLEDYARFCALHDRFQCSCTDWPADAVPDPEQVNFHKFLQTVFFRQWFDLKDYANQRGVRLMGDIPFYLSPDSVEMWREPELFQLDDKGHLRCVAGVPPDAFCPDGQLWGNPVYDWTDNERGVLAFWRRRIKWCAQLFDALRIDHFRAFYNYWTIPANAQTAKEGRWNLGPARKLLNALHRAAPDLELIAEDLGDLDADAIRFVRTCGVPGMKVLVFAFDPAGESAYLPHNCVEDCVVYSGTHDTPTFVEWLSSTDPDSARFAREYLSLRDEEGLGWGVIRGAWATTARLAMAPLQDVLGLGADARMNLPGTIGPHNWSWRVRGEALNGEVADRLAHLTRLYHR